MSRYIQLFQQFVTFISTTPGRDRSCRIVQYFSKFIKAIIISMQQHDPKNKSLQFYIDKLNSLEYNLEMTRKVFRWGRPIGHLVNIIKNHYRYKRGESTGKYDKTKDQIYILSSHAQDLFLMLYFLFDHLEWIVKIGILESRNFGENTYKINKFCWLLALIFTLIANIQEIILLNKSLEGVTWNSSIEQVDKHKQINKRMEECIIDSIRAFLDLPVVIGYLNPKIVSQGCVGFLGTITSYIGCVQNWK